MTDVVDAFVVVLATVVVVFFVVAVVCLGVVLAAAGLRVVVVVLCSGGTLGKKFGSKGLPKRPKSRLSSGFILTCSFSLMTAALGMRTLSSHITPVLPLVHTHS